MRRPLSENVAREPKPRAEPPSRALPIQLKRPLRAQICHLRSMESLLSSAFALRQVLGARNSFFLAQVPVIDLAELASTEAARLDFPEARARRLCDQVGLNVTLVDAARVYSVTEAFVSSRAASRRANAGAADAELTVEQQAAESAHAAARSEWDALVQEFDIDVSRSLRLLATTSKMQLEQPRGSLMLQSLLITAVAQFETFVSRLIVTSLRYAPAALNGSKKELSFADVSPPVEARFPKC